MGEMIVVQAADEDRVTGVWNLLKTYGIFPIKYDSGKPPHLYIFEGALSDKAKIAKEACDRGGNVIWICPGRDAAMSFGLRISEVKREEILKPKRSFGLRKHKQPAIAKFGGRRLGEGLAFEGKGIRPLLINGKGQCEAAAVTYGRGIIYWIGINIVDEIVRYRQGGADTQLPDIPYDVQKCTCERPWCYYSSVIAGKRAMLPEADIWGWLLASWVWDLMGDIKALVWPLPNAAKILSLFTADGDEASKEQFIKLSMHLKDRNIPCLHFMAQNTAKDEAWEPYELASGEEFAIHPVVYSNDAGDYEKAFKEQVQWFAKRFSHPPIAVRNHMFFKRGYLDLEEIWERESYIMNFNIPGLVDKKNRSGGICDEDVAPAVLNGSFQPFPYRRKDGSWMKHMGILTAYGDHNFLLYENGQSAARRWLRHLIAIMTEHFPGVFVAYFHPYNIEKNIAEIDRCIQALKERGSAFVRMSDWLTFMTARNSVSLSIEGGDLTVNAPVGAEGITLIVGKNSAPRAAGGRLVAAAGKIAHDYSINDAKAVILKNDIK